jgi:Flp pilus assembly CpaE family ATPase
VVEQSRLHQVLEYSRSMYDWVIVDLPGVFQRTSLVSFSESDEAFLVSTSELPSLHLTRKAVNFLGQIGITRDRYRIILNRAHKRDGIGGSDIEKIFNCSIHARLPNDYFSLHRAVTAGQALPDDCDLGKAIEGLAAKLNGGGRMERRRGGHAMEPALSQS